MYVFTSSALIFVMIDLWSVHSEIIRKMSTSEKPHKKQQKSGMSAFYLSGSAFLPISPLGNEKKRTFCKADAAFVFAFSPLFYRFSVEIFHIISLSRFKAQVKVQGPESKVLDQ